METPKTFKSSFSNTSFPWNIFLASLALQTFTFIVWSWSADKLGVLTVILCLIGTLVSICLSVFIHKIRVLCTRPVLIIKPSGIHIPGIVDIGSISWSNIARIKHFNAKVQNSAPQDCLGIDVFDLSTVLSKITIWKRALWHIIQFMSMEFRKSHTFVITSEQLTVDMSDVVDAIKPHKTIEFKEGGHYGKNASRLN